MSPEKAEDFPARQLQQKLLYHIKKCHSSPSLPPSHSYPSGFQQLPTKLLCRVVEGELLAAEMIDRRVALQVEEQVVIKANFLRLFLRKEWRSGGRRGTRGRTVTISLIGT